MRTAWLLLGSTVTVYILWVIWKHTTTFPRLVAWVRNRRNSSVNAPPLLAGNAATTGAGAKARSRFARFLNPRFLIGLGGFIVVVFIVFTLLDSGIQTITSSNKETTTVSGDSVNAVAAVGKTLIDSTLTSTQYIDKGFVREVMKVEYVNRTWFFLRIILGLTALMALLYSAKKWEWGSKKNKDGSAKDAFGKKLPSIPKTLPVFVLSLPIFHFIWWSLTPTLWENFYQSRAFWPINLGIIIAVLASAIAAKEGGKQIAKVVKYTMVVASLFLVYFMWPKNMRFDTDLISKARETVQPSGRTREITPEVASSIEKHFGDLGPDTVALMKRIALAESDGMQFNTDGSVVRNKDDGKATGIFQIHPVNFDLCYKHDKSVYTLDGNVGCARLVFDDTDATGAKRGTNPWNSSARRWRNSQESIPTTVVTSTQTLITSVSNTDETVRIIAPITPDSARVDEKEWSAPTYTEQKFFCWNDGGNTIPYEVRDDLGNTMEVSTGMHIKMSLYPKYLQFRSLGGETIEIIFTRSRKAC